MPSERVQRQIDRLLTEAETALADGQWEVVRKRADAVLRLDPGNRDATAYLDAAGRPSSLEAPASASDADKPASAVSAAAQEPTHARETPPVPTSFASGRYAVREFLGEGGKKRVFLAHDTTLDRDVAFALIKTEGLDDNSRQRITREAQAMGRLGDHPNIVPIFDLGQEKDPTTGATQPFMVLPLMSGGDVEGVIEKAPDHRVPLEQMLRIAKDTCEGLVFAHSKGIVHRDLKPGNVWLTERGAARIGDFGLAVATDRSRLTREAMIVGTVAYMPPEQAMGGEITPRADLYSLGAMLYEMVTGRPPFLGDDDIAIIGQHINTPPVAPTWHNPHCPKPLDALITRLLAKDPKQRPESARDVLSALNAIDPRLTSDSTSAQGAERDGAKAAERSLDSMSSGVFVGRHKEMDQLRAALEEVLSGHGRMVTLVGEPGIGKTRTAQELQTYAGLRRCQVLWGRCYEGGGAPPYWPWVQVIRQYVQERESEALRREMGSTVSILAEIVQDLKDKVPGILPPPQLDNPESARFRLFDSIASFLKNASRSQPLLIVLDDLHWADKPSLLLLEFVVRELSNSRILVVGTYRDVELNRRHPLAVTLGDLTKDRLFERVLLRGLLKQDIEKFIELAAGVKPPVGLVDAVYTQTEGNPLFVTEVVRLLVQEGDLSQEMQARRGAKTTTWIVRVPEGVREVIGRRLDRLSERCNDLLTIAAVIGRRFALAALVKLYSDPALTPEDRLSEDRVVELVEEALAARVIEELPSGPGRYQFTHALIEETLTGELSTTRKVRLHARVATALESLYSARSEDRAAELARHFREAETLLGTEKVVYYSRIAGERALAAYAYEEALAHFERAIAASGDDADALTVAELNFGLGRCLAYTADRKNIQRAANAMIRAFDAFVSKGQTERAVTVALSPFPGIHGPRGLAAMLERAVPLAPADSVVRGMLLASLVRWLGWERHEPARTREAFEEALAIARRNNDPRLEMHAHVATLGVPMAGYGLDDSLSHLERGAALAEKLGDSLVEALTKEVLGTAYLGSGELELADRYTSECVIAAERSKSRFHIAASYCERGIFEEARGNYQAASNHYDSGLALAPDEQRLLTKRAVLAAQLGDLDRAVDMIQTVQRIVKAYPDQWHALTLYALFAPIALLRITGRDVVEPWVIDFARGLSEQSPDVIPPFTIKSARSAIMALGVARADKSLVEQFFSEDLFSGTGTLRRSAFNFRAFVMGPALVMLERFEDAEDVFRADYDLLSKIGDRPSIAWLYYDWADLLLTRRGSSDDTKRAARLQDETLNIARDLGMKPLIERILRRREILRA